MKAASGSQLCGGQGWLLPVVERMAFGAMAEGKEGRFMAKYYCVLFDADNTLLNFDAAESKALAETLVNYGIEPDAETVQTGRFGAMSCVFLRVYSSKHAAISGCAATCSALPTQVVFIAIKIGCGM